ncbi:HET-domain-containing protein [Penicillium verhagenii]|uniref:HET-domain-containing protein n=1 Tax=Penicillium verhagenii TaxID=1562060 RepID=UPI002545A8B7|nr:HET-domain-containing protein [Penicillium verhagenii]KAJ5921097.1 HET-domain-containing protein [Penicillium verhagenii]
MEMKLIFKPLNVQEQEVRVLTIHPDRNFDNEIRCSLRTISLKKPVKFEALSYVWGGAEASEKILLEGYRFQVTPNLASALHYLRNGFRKRVIWIDFICIDQGNAEERNSQVLLMALVYRKCTRVISFLGNPNREIERMVSWTERYVHKKINKRTIYWWRLDGKAFFSAKARQEKELALAEAYHGTVELSALPYWTRLWTYQEYHLPECEPLCVCGHLKFKACIISKQVRELLTLEVVSVTDQFSQMKSHEHRKNQHVKKVATHLISEDSGICFTMHTDNRGGNDQNRTGQLSQLLWRTPRHQCSDPRDRIYALYGMAPAARNAYPPDYDKSVGQVMKEATKYIIEKELGLRALDAFVVREDNTSADLLPSWVPDFTRDLTTEGIYGSQYISVKPDKSLFEWEAQYQPYISPDLSTLHLWARRAGNCRVLFRFHTTVPGTALQIARFLDSVSNPGDSARHHGIIRSFLMHDPECLKLAAEDVLSAIREISTHYSYIQRGWQTELVSSVIDALGGTCGKSVFLTSNSSGRCLGVSGLKVSNGDLVVLASTASQPLILRKKVAMNQAQEPLFFQLVGPAFLDFIVETQTPNAFLDHLKTQTYEEYLVV